MNDDAIICAIKDSPPDDGEGLLDYLDRLEEMLDERFPDASYAQMLRCFDVAWNGRRH